LHSANSYVEIHGRADEDLKTLRLRFLLDQSVKNLMVLVGTKYTLNEKQLLTVTVLLKRVMDTPSMVSVTRA
jgi:hypothetical protein